MSDPGREMYELMERLYPICRSLTGDGVRQTLDLIEERIPLERTEVPSGTQVFDWTLPREWNIREAWLAGPDGERIVDFADSNLHVLGYSVPVRTRLPLSELRKHLFSDPERPDVTPYRTSYHNENWGFCLPHRQLEALEDGEYEAVIDSTLEDGVVTYAECLLPGETEDEVLLSTYICHPSLCNDNLSGIVLLTALAGHLQAEQRRYSYRFLFSPATIGPLTWLSRNEDRLHRVKHGLVAACVGDPGPLTYKRSRRGDAAVDRAAGQVVRAAGGEVRDFTPLGGDERQFCSPAFDLPVGVLSRTPQDEFPGYHSSADDLELVRPEHLADSFAAYLAVFAQLEADANEGNATYVNLNPKGEPQLGKRGLYRAVGGGSFAEGPLLWVLNLSDGRHDLKAIAERSGLAFSEIRDAADQLLEAGLLESAEDRVS
jgi:aminopeptidase-like protein